MLILRVDDDARHLVTSVDLVLREGEESHRLALSPTWRGFEGDVMLDGNPHVAFYHFELTLSNESVLVYAPGQDGRSTAGELKEPDGDLVQGFQISSYEPAFKTPTWFSGSIMYQVLPDRFARGTSGVRTQGIVQHERMGRPVHLRNVWDEPITWNEASGYDPTDFYGGTIEGICEKLPYFASLGVEVLYLNPVFEARSSHRYDTADYEHVDPLLGTDDDLKKLAGEAAEHGIAIVLDAVLSHTGSDSRYFNAYGTYDLPGAAQGPQSPYRTWYDFAPREEGAPYRCWWGDPTLPEVDERDEGWQRYMFGEILPKWLHAGVSGYRLDVADEIPDDVLEKLRTAVKAVRPETAIIGEVWEDATTKESYGAARTYALGRSLDSVMNYPLRDALIAFATGEQDAYQLATFLKLQQSNYPPALHRCLMNLLSSHDVERIRTVLALGKSIRHNPRVDQQKAVKVITRAQDRRAASLQAMLAGLLYALPGVPCIYYGDEKGMHGGSDPFCRAPMAWSGDASRPDVGTDLTSCYRKLGGMRKASQLLRNGAMACTALDEDVICIVRVLKGENGVVVAIANRGDKEKTVAVDLKALCKHAGFNVPVCAFEDGMALLTASPMETRYIFA